MANQDLGGKGPKYLTAYSEMSMDRMDPYSEMTLGM